MPPLKSTGVEPVYRTVIGAAITLFRTMDWRVRVHAPHHIPVSGGAVLASNHIGYLDFVFVGFGARERGRLVRFLAREDVFRHRASGPLMRAMRHIPVDRYGRAHDSFKAAVQALHDGELVGMFPEGTISRSFVPQPGKSGAARMAMDAAVPLVPCAVWGTQRILTKDRPRNLQRQLVIDVAYGEPIAYRSTEEPQDVTDRLMSRIRTMVADLAERYPQRPAGPADGWWLPAHMGGSAPTEGEALEMTARDIAARRAQRAAEDI